jgi:hypothetical protein
MNKLEVFKKHNNSELKVTKYSALILSIYLLLGMSGCGTDKNSSSEQSAVDLMSSPIADYELLFIGNSHSSVNGLPNLVTILIEATEQGKSSNATIASGTNFLVDRLNDGITQEVLESREWTHVFLQAQKYSSTGNFSYSTDAAEEWIRRIRTLDASPIMFPEWPRRGNTEEGQRVYDLHVSIASREPACVAPVGLVWDDFILRYPEIALHAEDGNHSNLSGALLSAFIFYQILTGKPANTLSYIAEIDVNEDIQTKLKEVALDFHNVHLPCS